MEFGLLSNTGERLAIVQRHPGFPPLHVRIFVFTYVSGFVYRYLPGTTACCHGFFNVHAHGTSFYRFIRKTSAQTTTEGLVKAEKYLAQT